MAEHHAERMISANGIEICSDSFGDPADPAVLLIMGAGSSMLLWETDFCQRLADGGRFVIRYDNRDTGKTTSCPAGEPNYTLQDMAADAVAVLDAYGIEQAHIMGASMGGMITQLVGLDYPERVLTLTPIMSTPDPRAVLDAIEGRETTFELSPPTPEVIANAMAMAELDWGDKEAVLENRVAMFKALAGSAYPYDEAARRELFATEIDRAVNFASTANHGAAVEATERWHDRLDTIDLRTLVVHGTADGILPFDHGQALAEAIPGATLYVMEDVGHEVPAGALDTLMPVLLDHTS